MTPFVPFSGNGSFLPRSLVALLGYLLTAACGVDGTLDLYSHVAGTHDPGGRPPGGDGTPPETPVPPDPGFLLFSWIPNPEPDLAGYHLYQSVFSGLYLKGAYMADVPALPGETKTYTMEVPAPGYHFWVLTSYDLDQNESGFSSEVSIYVE